MLGGGKAALWELVCTESWLESHFPCVLAPTCHPLMLLPLLLSTHSYLHPTLLPLWEAVRGGRQFQEWGASSPSTPHSCGF